MTERMSIDKGRDIEEVSHLLKAAGVTPSMVAFIVARPAVVMAIQQSPDLAYEFARRYPNDSVIEYHEVERDAGFFGSDLRFGGSGGPDAMAYNLQASQTLTSASGAVRYPDGVIVTAAGEIVFPNDPKVAGSQQWLSQVHAWDEEKVSRWRERLAETGYLATSRGGVSVDFIEALRTFHQARYLYGGGKPVAAEDHAQRLTEADFDGAIDRNVLRGEIRTWLAQAYGDEGSQDEQDFWMERLRKVAMRTANRQGLSTTGALGVARSKVEQEFLDSPSAQTAIDNDYENMSLKEDLEMAAQATDFLAFGR